MWSYLRGGLSGRQLYFPEVGQVLESSEIVRVSGSCDGSCRCLFVLCHNGKSRWDLLYSLAEQSIK